MRSTENRFIFLQGGSFALSALMLLSVFLSAFALASCSLLKANEAKDSGFLDNTKRLHASKNISKVWTSKKYRQERDTYTHVLVRPVNTSYLMTTGDWKHIQMSSEEEIKKDARKIAKDMEKAFRDAFREKRVPFLTLTRSLKPKTLVIEIALTELVPTDVYRNAAGEVAGFFVPGGGLLSAGAGGSIAIEMKMSDGKSKELLVMAKDRRVDKIAPVDLAGLTPYQHAEQNIADWVDATVEALNAPVDADVDIASPITLSPW